MCEVVFITPNMKGDIVEEAIGTLQLATILKNQGISCEILQFFRIGDVSDFDNFIKKVCSKSHTLVDTDVSTINNILTLSTCSYEGKDSRTIVHAKLISNN